MGPDRRIKSNLIVFLMKINYISLANTGLPPFQCPENIQQYAKRQVRDDTNNPTETPTERSLVRLHKRVIRALQDHHRTQCQWNTLVEKAFDLQDIAQSELAPDRKFRRSFRTDHSLFRFVQNATVGALT